MKIEEIPGDEIFEGLQTALAKAGWDYLHANGLTDKELGGGVLFTTLLNLAVRVGCTFLGPQETKEAIQVMGMENVEAFLKDKLEENR